VETGGFDGNSAPNKGCHQRGRRGEGRVDPAVDGVVVDEMGLGHPVGETLAGSDRVARHRHAPRPGSARRERGRMSWPAGEDPPSIEEGDVGEAGRHDRVVERRDDRPLDEHRCLDELLAQVPATRVVKRAVGLPVVAVGRIVMPEEAEGFLVGGDCDFIGLSRALIADPMWGMKAEQGRSEDIRPCVGANWCMESIFAQAPIACIHNPAAGAEAEMGEGTLRPAKAAKRVAVVGAGPAGMQAAASAARRGHEVVLFEQREELGGQVAWWSRATVRKELRAILTHLERLLRLAKVEIRLGHAPGEAELAGFDSVIVATGSTPLRHGWTPLRPDRWAGAPLPGADLPHVYTLADVLGAPQPLVEGERVVIYDAIGGRQAMVAADHLAELGRKVSFVTTLGQPGPNLAASRDWGKVYGRLRRMGVQFRTDRELVAVAAGEVTERDLYTKELFTEPADAVVMVLGSSAQDSLFHRLKAAGHADVHLIGDAMAPRRVSDAIREGERVARRL
jgi:NADPH-dependent 2,4-dienoyl-CoA reductase/sulfur reductase-like enzyme